MEQNLLTALKAIGLSEKETQAYITLLELGEAPVKDITLKSELNRVTVYPVLKSLMEKGFVSQFSQDRKTFFKAIDPKQILDIIKEKENKIKSVLPLLEARKGSIKSKTSIEIFRGPKGISAFLEKLYSGEEKQFYAYGSIDSAKEGIRYQSLHGRNLRKLKNIKLNAIVNRVRENEKEYVMEKTYQKLTDIRMNPALDNMHLYIIFSEKIVGILEITQEPVGILMQNPEIASYHKQIFDMFLKESKKVS
jgi:sugar-specific transcriptional regulator TrmB